MLITNNLNGTYDNRESLCREWYVGNMMIYWQSAELIEKTGRTVFGAFPDHPANEEAL